MIRLRFDVDYAFHSRLKSLLNMAGYGQREGLQYLVEAKCAAMEINAAAVPVKAYWFFTPYTLPDKALLTLLTPDKHEVGLHVVKDPKQELAKLEQATQRKIQYYTVHGTRTAISQVIWGRCLGQKEADIPNNFPLESLHSKLTHSLDRDCYGVSCEEAFREASKRVEAGFVLAMHPEWLFASNGKDRGPYHNVLHRLLRGGLD